MLPTLLLHWPTDPILLFHRLQTSFAFEFLKVLNTKETLQRRLPAAFTVNIYCANILY